MRQVVSKREISAIDLRGYLMTILAFGLVEACDLLLYPKRFHMIVTRMLGQT